MDFDETWYSSFLRKSVEKIQVLLQSDKNNGYFTWKRFHICDNISLNFSKSEKYYGENQYIHFVISNLFPKVVPFMRQCRKILWSQRGYRWRHNMASTRCILDKQGYTRACTLPRTSSPTRTHVHTRTDKYVILFAFPQQRWLANAPQCYVIPKLPVCLVSLSNSEHFMFTIMWNINTNYNYN